MLMRTSLEKLAAININPRPLKFDCLACGQPIIVKYLKRGEKAQCFTCGKFNEIPPDAVETDENPDYISIRKAAAANQSGEKKDKKLLSTRRVSSSAVLAFLVNSLIDYIDKKPSGLKHFILIFIVAYLCEYLLPEKREKRQLSREIAKSSHSCHVCARIINRGELCYYENGWRNLISKARNYFCLKCYGEIFNTPELPIENEMKPHRGFKFFLGG
jgi:hypothetical protein